MKNFKKIINANNKLACITIDIEEDFGNRVKEFNILIDNENKILQLANLFKELNIPISIFVVTELLSKYSNCLEIIKNIGQDFHCHSHTHNTNNASNVHEIKLSAESFKHYFGYNALGYRAPQGVLMEGDIEIIKKCGFMFSSSIFPSYRIRKFNNLSLPIDPFYYENGIVELPLAVVPKLRYIISLSYLKILGMRINKLMYSYFGLPNIIVFDSHLHDYLISDKSYNKLKLHLRCAYGINKYLGMDYFTEFIKLLRSKKYKFMTMTELYHYLNEG